MLRPAGPFRGAYQIRRRKYFAAATIQALYYSGIDFKGRFVLSTDLSTPYPQHISFQVTQDKCNMLDQFNPGDELRVQFNLRGREWNGPQGIKYFNTLDFKINNFFN